MRSLLHMQIVFLLTGLQIEIAEKSLLDYCDKHSSFRKLSYKKLYVTIEIRY